MIFTLDHFAALRASLIFLHLLIFAAAAGFILLGDIALFGWRRINGTLLRLSARWVSVCLLGLWLSGAAVVGLDTSFDLGRIAHNDKLLAKLTVVSILTLNGILLHRFAFPCLVAPLPADVPSVWVPALLGGISASTWVYAAFIGVAKPFAALGYSGLMALYGLLVSIALAVAMIYIRPRLARQLTTAWRSQRGVPVAVDDLYAPLTTERPSSAIAC